MKVKNETAQEIKRKMYFMISFTSCYSAGGGNQLHEMKCEEDAHVISSLCESGLHAPALDFDFPVECCWGNGKFAFRKPGIPGNAFYKLKEVLIQCGLGNPLGQFSCGASGAILTFSDPVRLVESSTPGHFHFYIEKKIPWQDYKKMLKAFLKAGLIDENFYDMSMEEKMTMLFLPGVKKV